MGLMVKASFAAGELDPVLHERTTLDKYRAGLATARNVVVGKTGSILSRQGRFHFAACKLDDRKCVLYSPPGSGMLLEWGHLYVRVYTLTGLALAEIVHARTEADLPNIHFETSGAYVYIFCGGKAILKFNYVIGVFMTPATIFAIPPAPTNGSPSIIAVGAPTGYKVEYAITYVFNGQESFPILAQGNINVPIAAGQSNTIDIELLPVVLAGLTEMRVYRRPTSAGSYGFLGSSSFFYVTGGTVRGSFTDLGQDADYTHQYPTVITPSAEDPIDMLSSTGVIYQQRLLITDTTLDLEAIYASQPGYQNNFFRNYPIDSASALKFKCGTSGYARILRLLDSDGLVAFTSAGIYLNQGELGPNNLSMARKGRWVINSAIPPLAVPGGVLFCDGSTNSIRNLLFNFEKEAFDAEEVSIYSAHLFRTRQLSSWNFQEGVFPLLWVVFTDGSMATFTFEFDQQMKAWTRHDSDSAILVESSTGTINPDTTFFVVTKEVNGVVKRYIEYSIVRFVPASYIAADPDYDKNPSIAYMDSVVSYATVLNDLLVGDDVFTLIPTTNTVDENGDDTGIGDWSGPLRILCGTSNAFVAYAMAPGPFYFRCFDEDGAAYTLKTISFSDANNGIVQPDIPFPSDLVPRLYVCANTFSTSGAHNLAHMEGEYPSVIVDGAVMCSPNNDVDNYPELQIVNGVLTLPTGVYGAIVHIGRPITGDVETLDIDTVEQAPTLIESLNVNKLYIKVHNSSGLFVGNKFPAGNSVAGMEALDSYDVNYQEENPIIGNRAQPNQTKRVELTLPGDWKSQGKVCIRQVDPLHFEILSIIPDSEILYRSSR